jgi:hypothetical protein
MPAVLLTSRHAQNLVLLLIAIQVIFNIYNSHRSIRRLDGENSSKDESVLKISGVGVVTNDGIWPQSTYTNEDIKIVAFADKHYVALAKVWYERLSSLGYTEHYIVCVDEKAHKKLSQENYRLIKKYIINPDYAHPVVGFGRQLYSLRLQFTLEMLQNGTHVLVTDVDTIFNRYVPLAGFLEERFDLMHMYEMKYPTNLFQENGFVVCAGHQFLRASPATIAYLRDEVLGDCIKENNCDDQVRYNVALHKLRMLWSADPMGDERIKISSNVPENDGLLVEQLTGTATLGDNHDKLSIKIWDRDFAWRLSNDLPQKCPTKDTNWVAMPTKTDDLISDKRMNKVWKKIEMFRIWDDLCRGGDTR